MNPYQELRNFYDEDAISKKSFIVGCWVIKEIFLKKGIRPTDINRHRDRGCIISHYPDHPLIIIECDKHGITISICGDIKECHKNLNDIIDRY